MLTEQAMKVSITSIELRSPFKFFPLSLFALHILKQLENTECKEFKKRGIWTLHYTMTLWETEEQMRTFVKSGAHLDAMKKGASISKEIRSYTYDADQLPNWKEAKLLLKEKGKAFHYGKKSK